MMVMPNHEAEQQRARQVSPVTLAQIATRKLERFFTSVEVGDQAGEFQDYDPRTDLLTISRALQELT